MMKVTNNQTGREFPLLRKRETLNDTLQKFYNDFDKSEGRNKEGFIKEIYNILILYREPKKNYYVIDNKWVEFELKFGAFDLINHFNLSPTKKADTNEVLSVRPMLFEEADAFFIFLDAILYSLKGEILKTGNSQKLPEAAQFFKNMFKREEDWKKVIIALSAARDTIINEPWFDSSGNFIRKGRGRTGQDNPSAVSDLLARLNNKKYFTNEIELNFDDKISEYAEKGFKLIIAPKSKTVTRTNKFYPSLCRLIP